MILLVDKLRYQYSYSLFGDNAQNNFTNTRYKYFEVDGQEERYCMFGLKVANLYYDENRAGSFLFKKSASSTQGMSNLSISIGNVKEFQLYTLCMKNNLGSCPPKFQKKGKNDTFAVCERPNH